MPSRMIVSEMVTIRSMCAFDDRPVLHGRRARACDRTGDVGNLLHNPPANGLVDRVPGGKETVNIRRAYAEFGGDVGHRCLVITDAAKVLLRHHQDARAPRRDQFPFGSDDSWMSPRTDQAKSASENLNRLARQQSPTRQPLLVAIPIPP